jgi:hypothetical protein
VQAGGGTRNEMRTWTGLGHAFPLDDQPGDHKKRDRWFAELHLFYALTPKP